MSAAAPGPSSGSARARSGPAPGIGRFVGAALGTLLLALPSACTLAGPGAGPVGTPHPERDEVRALWVVRTTLARPESVRTMVRRADRAGFNTLLVQVRGRGDAYYRSRLEPAPSSLSGAPEGYDPLALVLREARARGLAVHAWVNVHLVSGIGPLPADPGHLVRSRPELLAVPRSLARDLHDRDPGDPAYLRALLEHARDGGNPLEGLYTSPGHPAVEEHVLAVLTDLVDRYDVDGVHLDYIRYPSADFGYSPASLRRFRAWARSRLSAARVAELDRKVRSDPLAYPDALPELWDDFRRARVTGLVRGAYRAVRGRRPQATVSAAVVADPVDAYRHRLQDWPGWLDEGIVDVAVPMAYTDDEERFGRWIGEAVRRAGDGERIWAGIGFYRTTVPGAIEQVAAARSRGVGGVAVFSYDWAVGSSADGGPDARLLQRLGQGAFGSRARGR